MTVPAEARFAPLTGPAGAVIQDAPPRRVMLFMNDEPLKCFNGHSIQVPVIEQGVVVCRHPVSDPSRSRRSFALHDALRKQCGQFLYLLAGFSSMRGDGGGVLVTEIDETEQRLLNRSGLSPRDVMRILGLAPQRERQAHG